MINYQKSQSIRTDLWLVPYCCVDWLAAVKVLKRNAHMLLLWLVTLQRSATICEYLGKKKSHNRLLSPECLLAAQIFWVSVGYHWNIHLSYSAFKTDEEESTSQLYMPKASWRVKKLPRQAGIRYWNFRVVGRERKPSLNLMNHILQRRNKHDSFVELLRTSCFMISSTQVVPS